MIEMKSGDPQVEAIRQRLEDYKDSTKELQHQKQRLERLEMRMYSIGSPNLTGMPKEQSQSTSREADLVCDKIDLEREIEQLIAWRKKERAEINKIVRKLKNADERAVIRYRYLDGVGWNDIPFEIFGDEDDFSDREDSYIRRTFHLHGSALKHMALLIAGSTSKS